MIYLPLTSCRELAESGAATFRILLPTISGIRCREFPEFTNIDLKANQAGAANTLFTIGGSGNSNGVNGTITAKPAGYDPYFAPAIVHVVNGIANSTGGITLTSASSIITTPQPGSRAAYVFLNARNGTLTIPAGTLSANGGTSDGAGLIALMAKTIAFGTNATVTAAQSSTAAGTLHGVLISAEKVTYQGTGGLNLIGSGNGADAFSTGYVQVYPQGVVTISDTETPFNLVISAVIGSNQAGNVTFQGTGTAPLNITADGNDTRIAFTGTTLTFTGGAVKMQARGATNHKIRLQNPGTLTGANVGLNFSGTGAVTLDVLGVAGAGGDIELFLDKATFNKTTYTFTANGPTASNGNGGTVYVGSQLLTLSPTAKFTITANASSFGTGDAIASDPSTGDPKAIRFYPGAVPLNIGTASGLGQISFSAKGGQSGGKGGTILISSDPVTVKTANAINASAVGGNGDGGEVVIYSYVQSLDPAARISAIGKGTGKGGKVTFNYANGTDTLDLNTIVKVGGGNTLTSAGGLDGRMVHNGISCQQFRVGTSWPKSYWNCAHPDAPTTAESTLRDATVLLPSTFKTALNGTYLYVFTKAADYNSFFKPATTLGIEAQGFSTSSKKRAVVFGQKGAGGTDISLFLKGALMHELGHLLNAVNGNPQGTAGFIAAYTADMNNMIGNYPTLPQSPTCIEVFLDNPFCIARSADANPWVTMQSVYIGAQPVDSEMFAFAFQTCSGYSIYDLPLDNVQFTNRYDNAAPGLGYMANVNIWMNTYWPGGCH